MIANYTAVLIEKAFIGWCLKVSHEECVEVFFIYGEEEKRYEGDDEANVHHHEQHKARARFLLCFD